MESVILVDRNDNEIGVMPKMEAHLVGALHRAFSIFIFNRKGELLLQQRAWDKYHSGGKWTNTCCSHPRATETTLDAAHRRLKEEMGLQCHLTYGFNFVYKAEVTEGVLEHEFDHVYFGVSDRKPVLDPEEVADYSYACMEDLADDLVEDPSRYTEWLKICFNEVMNYYNQHFKNGNIC